VSTPSPEITTLLKAWRRGDRGALDRLTPLVYEHLRKLAHAYVRKERGEALDATGLVHEAYVRLVDGRVADWQDRAHFFAVCARTMRRILVDAARARATAKRGGGLRRVEDSPTMMLEQVPDTSSDRAAEICALDDALEGLARLDPRRAQVVEMRFFAGLTVEETAQALSVSEQTVIRDWRLARAWLARELRRTRA
jgi:RNA polymerase sigma factor (TIGR02999 family)